MVEFATLMYGMLAIFVLASIERNHREERANPQIVTLVGWGLCSMSATLAGLVLGLVLLVQAGAGIDLSVLLA